MPGRPAQKRRRLPERILSEHNSSAVGDLSRVKLTAQTENFSSIPACLLLPWAFWSMTPRATWLHSFRGEGAPWKCSRRNVRLPPPPKAHQTRHKPSSATTPISAPSHSTSRKALLLIILKAPFFPPT